MLVREYLGIGDWVNHCAFSHLVSISPSSYSSSLLTCPTYLNPGTWFTYMFSLSKLSGLGDVCIFTVSLLNGVFRSSYLLHLCGFVIYLRHHGSGGANWSGGSG